MEWKEAPIIARTFVPHVGTRFKLCAFCLFSSNRRQVKADVIVYTTYEGIHDPAIRGLCSHHAELLKPIKR